MGDGLAPHRAADLRIRDVALLAAPLRLGLARGLIPVAVGIVAIAAQVGRAIRARAAVIGLALLRCLLLRRRLDRRLIIGFLAQSGKLHPGAVRALMPRGIGLLLVIRRRLRSLRAWLALLRSFGRGFFRGRFRGAGFGGAGLGGGLRHGFLHRGDGGGGVIAAAAAGGKEGEGKEGDKE